MSLLIPLGLLGLIGIAALILIYILKPNYQQKVISSTYIWKLSIKYKKKKIPINKLRNILLIICQVLIIVSCALIMAKPVQMLREKIDEPDVVIVIDSSASMRTQIDYESRYIRAVDEAIDLSEDIFSRDGFVSVILADKTPEYLTLDTEETENPTIAAVRITKERKEQLNSALKALKLDETECSYGSADMDQTMNLCSEVVDVNPDARIYFYTDSDYAYVPEGIKVINLSDEEEWNASILNAYTELQDNHYTFYVDVACYGRAEELNVNLQIQGANTESKEEKVKPIDCYGSVFCIEDKTKTLVFSDRDPEEISDYEKDSENIVFVSMTTPITSYQSVHVSIDVIDSFVEDNDFDIYNGLKEILRVQYASPMSNPFVNSALDVVRNNFAERWDMRISEIRDENYELSGCDFYIFEHYMPDIMPVDGVVFLINPDKAPAGLEMNFGGSVPYSNQGLFLSADENHPIMNYVKPESITVSLIRLVTGYDASYKVLMRCEDNPALLVKDEADSKVVVMPFSVHYSNIALEPLPYFTILLSNMFDYFLPAAVSGNSFEVNESISLNARGSELTVTYNGELEGVYDSFPASLTPQLIGTYVLTQETLGGKKLEDTIFVKIPNAECNIWRIEDSLKNPFAVETFSDYYNDLLLYFAIALVSLLFIEWLLQMRENM